VVAKKVEPLHIGDDRGLPRLMGCIEIGGAKSAAQPVVGDHVIHPGKAVKMVLVKLARRRSAHRRKRPFRVPG